MQGSQNLPALSLAVMETEELFVVIL